MRARRATHCLAGNKDKARHSHGALRSLDQNRAARDDKANLGHLLPAPLAPNKARRRHAGWRALDVAVKPSLSALFPILRIVGVDAGSATQSAEKDPLRRTHHDSHMPGPCHQISRLRMTHPLEIIASSIEIGGTGIAVGKPSLDIYSMHQVGTITLSTCLDARVERSGNYRQPIVRAQPCCCRAPACILTTGLGHRIRTLGLLNLGLGPGRARSESAQNYCPESLRAESHALIL
jgi:hypothetical protein